MVYSARLAPLTHNALAALLALLAGCGDAATDGGATGKAALAIAPEYPAGFVAGSLDLVVDQVKLRVVRPPAEWVVDTTATFPENVQSVTMRVQVPLKARVEHLDVVLELWAGPLLIFAGGRSVEVAEGSRATEPTGIPLTYRGPGAEARNIRITPRDTVLRPGEVFGFGVLADNGSGVPVGDVYVSWSVTGNSGASILPSGVLTAAGTRGSVRLHARAATGATDSSRIWFAPEPTQVRTTSGGGQVAVVGTTLAAPLVTRVLAEDGLGVPGVLVQFSSATGGVAEPGVVRTDAEGIARATATLGGQAGAQSFTAAVPGLSEVQFQFQGTVDAPSQIAILRGTNQVTPPGQPLAIPLEVVVKDQYGNNVGGVLVRWDVVAGGGALGLTESMTDGGGHALSAYQMGPTPVTNLVRATLVATGTSVVFVLPAGSTAP
ncbi:MAG TPA: hypothetical protein VMK53_09700 [Gemmatimonadales bacterium]|nr:hypothetical protein [Gemmatimonadales bacterium]